MNDASEQYYQARIPIYPRSVRGRFRSLKWGILALAYGVYFALPWLRWNREYGPEQAVMFDIPGRRFYLFDLVVYPQDIFWLAGFLMIAAVLLFLVTGVAGRVFCGYFCFQTLWTDVYMFIERVIQGERPARMRLDKQPWGVSKVLKKGATHASWLLVAFATGLTFTLYWADAGELVVQFFTGEAPFPAYATTLFLTTTTYMMAGLAREQVCTYMCPYARFQAVMFDRDTLIVSYDERRGEGTTGRAKAGGGLRTREARQAAGAGDCIDCGYCVQVCPTGIDIRDGLQYQCIHCALCIDACDNIMDRMGWPRGLIRYTSERALEGGKTRYLKSKTLGYSAALLIMTGLLIWSIATQAPLDATVMQVRQPLHVQLSDGSIQNSYEIRVNNKTQRPVELKVALDGPPDMTLDLGRVERIRLQPEHGTTLLARVRYQVPAGQSGPFDLTFRIVPQDTDEIPTLEMPAHFYVP
ncbi:cytochrome c oxidase accessory protein CcoG [Thioalkalivibrio denitrificans]|uniref:Cytochrome c oxidase accessory protein CcoG n=1 Tax=Thioalkalivibrio denitrificans TaxID=108003 RepID=A0A1V3NDZ2_9GAMM|nr:cytochrome c oxidase accessory protein CcoG [Thioalkalivibrio denitrificans]OOG23082.1 cytochrome c oxidase accessory protein CcoG [Thioalkalivibrio denitrificans]